MTTANLDHLAALTVEYDNLTAEIKRLTEAQAALKAHIQHVMGNADVATIGGKPAFTWRPTGQFNAKRFATEQPEAAERYTVLVPVIDQDKLKTEQPDLFAAYRAKTFLRKG